MTTTEKADKSAVRPFGAVDAVCLLVIAVLLLCAVLLLAVPRAMGLDTYVVTSGSMEPTLHRGDLIFVRKAGFDDVEPGNVIALRVGDAVLTHRVWEMDAAGRTLRTRADASAFLDPFTVTEDAILGRAVYRLPLLGYPGLWFGGGEGAA